MIGTSALAIIVIALAGAIIAALGYAVRVVREASSVEISNVGSEE